MNDGPSEMVCSPLNGASSAAGGGLHSSARQVQPKPMGGFLVHRGWAEVSLFLQRFSNLVQPFCIFVVMIYIMEMSSRFIF